MKGSYWRPRNPPSFKGSERVNIDSFTSQADPNQPDENSKTDLVWGRHATQAVLNLADPFTEFGAPLS